MKCKIGVLPYFIILRCFTSFLTCSKFLSRPLKANEGSKRYVFEAPIFGPFTKMPCSNSSLIALETCGDSYSIL